MLLELVSPMHSKLKQPIQIICCGDSRSTPYQRRTVNFDFVCASICFIIFRPHKWGRKIMICDALFLLILPKLTLSLLHLCTLFNYGGPVRFEPGLVLEFFCFPACRSWVRTSPSPYFFAISVSRCLASVLLITRKYPCSALIGQSL